MQEELSDYMRGYQDGLNAQLLIHLDKDEAVGDTVDISGKMYISFDRYDELVQLYNSIIQKD